MKNKLGDNEIEFGLVGEFSEVSSRTDEKMRNLLEFCLQAAIISDNAPLVAKVL